MNWVGVAIQTHMQGPISFEYAIIRHLMGHLYGLGTSDLIYPSLANRRNGDHRRKAYEVYSSYGRIPLFDFVMIQALWITTHLPEVDRPKTNREFAIIVVELLKMDGLKYMPVDLHKNYKAN